MSIKVLHIVLAFVAFLASMLMFGPILKIARTKNIVDAPAVRKLQQSPVPVMGGIVVYFGILVGLCFFKAFVMYTSLLPVLGAMTTMLFLGAIDDILSISPTKRFLIEIMVALLLIYGTRHCISNFQGLWGITSIQIIIAIILSVFTFVGIVNSINMIDGVDGLMSSFSILILGFLGIACYYGDEFSYSAIAAVAMGAILPFFFHNVFGKETKMFSGDGGSLMMGTLISAMVFAILRKGFEFNPAHPFSFSRIAFAVAVLSIPLADTIRVMFVRIIHGRSPFSADKNHLHHLLLGINCSYQFTTLLEIILNLFVIAVFYFSWKLGGSVGIQLYSVVAATAVFDWAFAYFLSRAIDKRNGTYRILTKVADHTHFERMELWQKAQSLIDSIFKGIR